MAYLLVNKARGAHGALRFGRMSEAREELVERGLRALAQRLKVTVHKTNLTYATWEKVIIATENKVKALTMKPGRRKRKMDELEFYQGVLLEYRAMKDVVRNVVSHARDSYDEGQAASAFNHVRGFMQKFAARMSP